MAAAVAEPMPLMAQPHRSQVVAATLDPRVVEVTKTMVLPPHSETLRTWRAAPLQAVMAPFKVVSLPLVVVVEVVQGKAVPASHLPLL
jgi:hypothetical protein